MFGSTRLKFVHETSRLKLMLQYNMNISYIIHRSIDTCILTANVQKFQNSNARITVSNIIEQPTRF